MYALIAEVTSLTLRLFTLINTLIFQVFVETLFCVQRVGLV